MALSWLLFPVVLLCVGLGCGLLVQSVAGNRLPPTLLLGVGLAGVIVVGQPATLSAGSAELLVPLTLAAMVAGVLLVRPWPPSSWVEGWALLAGGAAFLAYAAPFLFAGEPTLGGYIKLDDTASWLAITERLIHHGDSLAGLGPSSYEATLDFYLGSRYPNGAFVPLAAGSVVSGQDPAWLYHPYLALLGLMLAMALYELTAGLIDRRWVRAAVAAVSAQPATLFAYVVWGGNKEIAAAWLLALVVALIPSAARGEGLRRCVPIAVVSAAMVQVLSPGGMLWLTPVLAAIGLVLIRRVGLRRAVTILAPVVILAVALSAPAFLALDFLGNPAASTITNESRLANLIQPLSPLQAFGVWPTGEFRVRPDELEMTYLLIAVAATLAVVALVASWRREWRLPLYLAAGVFGCLVSFAVGSPWVQAKALATASPALVLAALAGAVFLFTRGRRVEGAIAGIAVVAGVVASNFLAYRDANLAPYERFAELDRIGDIGAGGGPTLMTEYEPYGVRYFLREADPEGASELRRRRVPLRNGDLLQKGRSADIDAFDQRAVFTYDQLVLRRSPFASRPPSAYRREFRGNYYELWRRDPREPPPRARLPLGGPLSTGGRPRCVAILRMARGARSVTAALARPAPIVVDMSSLRLPRHWASSEGPAVLPREAGSVTTEVSVPQAGPYELWLGGSARGEVEILIDGVRVAARRHELSHAGQYFKIGSAELTAGRHAVSVGYAGPDLHPGSGGEPFALGPLVLAEVNEPQDVLTLSARDARSLCGRRLDWVESY